jgi:hypothetical protein
MEQRLWPDSVNKVLGSHAKTRRLHSKTKKVIRLSKENIDLEKKINIKKIFYPVRHDKLELVRVSKSESLRYLIENIYSIQMIHKMVNPEIYMEQAKRVVEKTNSFAVKHSYSYKELPLIYSKAINN